METKQKIRDVVAKINQLIKEKKDNELEKFVKDNPNFARAYVEMQTIEIGLSMAKINMVVLMMSHEK